MKNTSKWWVRLCYMAFFPTLLFNSCKKDDNGPQQELQNKHEHLKHSSSERVNAADIPEIMDFVSQQSKGNLKFTLQGKPGTREADLVDIEVFTEDILAMTNEADMSNYSFKMDAAAANEDEVVNFVVKEKDDGVYGYIIRYRPTEDWLLNRDWNEFSGDMLFYGSEGAYVAMQTLELGNPTTNDLRFPCPPDNGSGNSSSGGSGGGPSGTGSTGTGSNGSSGTGGNGGGGVVTVITCGCTGGGAPHTGGNQTTGCDCPLPDITIIEIRSMDPTGEIENFLRTGDPCPPVEDCYDEFLDPCVCAPDGVTCLVVEENEEVGINNVPTTNLNVIISINSLIEPDLTPEQLDWLYYEPGFADAALDALQNDGEVDFDEKIIFTSSFVQTRAYCVFQLLIDGSNSLFRDTMSQFNSNSSGTPLVFDYAPEDPEIEANTHYDAEIDVAIITFNSNNNSANANALEVASTLLHEGIHAELFVVIENGNNVPNPLPQYQYDYMLGLLEYYSNNGAPQFINGNSQHTFMANNHVTPIASAVSSLDSSTHPLNNYMYFGWTGLSEIGIPAGLISQADWQNFEQLAQQPLNDNHQTDCD